MMNAIRFHNLDHRSNLLSETRWSFAHATNSDCELILSGGTCLRVHRVVLAASSPIFAALLAEEVHDSHPVIDLTSFNVDETAAFLTLIYEQPSDEESLVPMSGSVLTQLLGINPQQQDHHQHCNEVEVQTANQLQIPESVSRLINRNKKEALKKSEEGIKRNLIESIKEPGNRCLVCGVKSGNAEDMMKHMFTVHGQASVEEELQLRKFICCDRVFFDKEKWAKHRLRVHFKAVAAIRQSLRCHLCQRDFSFSQELRDSSLDYEADSDGDSWRCPLGCQEQNFVNCKQLSEHLSGCGMLQKLLCPRCGDFLKSNHSEEIQDDVKKKKKIKMNPKRRTRPKTNQCSQCDLTFAKFSLLELHLKREHGIVERYECETCGHTANSLKKAKLHLNVHRGQYKCKLCGKTFAESTALHSHERTHVRRSGLKCEQCDRNFGSEKTLSDHVNSIHRRLRPYKCDLCDFASPMNRGLIRHKNQSHNAGITL